MEMELFEKDFHHLYNDDLDPESKLELTYKVLKDQLRVHQQKLIAIKEKKLIKKERRMS
jgi:hypothetical protein